MRVLRGQWEQGFLIKRYKRFLADVRLAHTGRLITAHCPNTGAMTGCIEVGADVWLSHSDDPARRTQFTLELTRLGKHMIGLNTHNANRLIEDAIRKKKLGPDLHDDEIEREIAFNGGRLDFKLGGSKRPHFIEVKSVTLMTDQGAGWFPDAKSDRAVKHLNHLVSCVERGAKATLLFCVQHGGIQVVRPAEFIHPEYAQALKRAVSLGVSCRAFKATFRPPYGWISREIKVEIP